MEPLKDILLGLTQGLTEFIPVSSSGHEVLLQNFISGFSNHLTLQYINIGTLLALLVHFRAKIWQIFTDVFRHREYRLLRNILITSVPAGMIGLFLSDIIASSSFFSNSVTVAVALAVVGAVMIVLEKLPKASKVETGKELPWRRALAIGLAQALALIPGVSRSGSTIIVGRLSGLNARAAAEYSFLASIPLMSAVILKLFVSSSNREYLAANLSSVVLINSVAFAAGLLAIRFLLKYLSKHDLKIFGYYRVILAAVILIYVAL